MHRWLVALLAFAWGASAPAQEVRAVLARGTPGYPHIVFPGRPVTLKAVLRNPEPGAEYRWRWDVRGDGFDVREGPVIRPEAIETIVVYTQPPERLFPAVIRVDRIDGGEVSPVGEDVYPVLLLHETPEAQAAVAVSEALWFLHKAMDRHDAAGMPCGTYPAEPWRLPDMDAVYTAAALEAFARADAGSEAYAGTRLRLRNALLAHAVMVPLTPQAHGDPDANANGFGISITGTPQSGAVLHTAFALTALALAAHPLEHAPLSAVGCVSGRTFAQIAQDMADYLVFAQIDTFLGRGGWRYRANELVGEHPTSGWVALALNLACERFGAVVPAWCREEALLWVRATQSDDRGGFGAMDSTNQTVGRTASGLALLRWAGGDPLDPTRETRAAEYIAAWWCQPALGPCVNPCIWDPAWSELNESLTFGNPFSMYGVARFAAETAPVIEFFGAHAWREEFARFLTAHAAEDPATPCLGRQAVPDPAAPHEPHGYWPMTTLNSQDVCGEVFNTALAVNVLLAAHPCPPPVALLRTSAYLPEVGEPTRFDATGSIAPDGAGGRARIVRYVFDFGDGSPLYVEEPGNAPDGAFDGMTAHVYTTPAPHGLMARMEITAEFCDGALRDAHTEVFLRPSITNRPPVGVITIAAGAEAIDGGPQCPECSIEVYALYPFALSGASSYDPDLGDAITRLEWFVDDVPVGEGEEIMLEIAAPGAVSVRLRVTDEGNPFSAEPKPRSAETTVAILVREDTLAPVITPPPDLTLPCAGPDGTPPPAAWRAQVEDDRDPAPHLATDLPELLPLGVTVVTFHATDRAGNSAVAEAVITVLDGTPPVLTCPPSLVLEAVGPDGAPRPETWPITCADDCDADPRIEDDAPSVFPLGTTPVTITAIDASGNFSTCELIVIVEDTTPPVIFAPEQVVLQCEEGGAPAPALPDATAFDLVDGEVPVTADMPAFLPLGTTTILLEARDAAGNTATAAVIFLVIDTEPPDIACPAPLILYSVGGSSQAPPPHWRATAYDACNGEIDVVCTPTGPFAPGRTLVTWTAADAAGNQAQCVAEVTVVTGAPFIRGDVNDDGLVQISDVVFLLSYLFAGGDPPPCLDAADVDDSATLHDDGVDIADAVRLLSYLFAGGEPPPAPFPECGIDTTFGTVFSCERHASCGQGSISR